MKKYIEMHGQQNIKNGHHVALKLKKYEILFSVDGKFQFWVTKDTRYLNINCGL